MTKSYFGITKVKKQTPLKHIRMSDDEDDEKQSLFSISQAQQHSNHFIVRIHANIAPPSEYSALFQLFESASEDDEILLDINNFGGVGDTAILMSRAIQGCDALVKARIGPSCASAATIIVLSCDGFGVDEHSGFHIHTASFSPGYGKSPDVYAATIHNHRQIEKLVRGTYANFLSEEEIEKVLDGKEVYLDSDDLKERLPGYIEERDKERLAMMQEIESDYDEEFWGSDEKEVDNPPEKEEDAPKPPKRNQKKE